MFWEIFYNLCKKSGTSPNAVAKELEFSSGSVTFWKKGKTPQYNSLKKIADYFGVSVEYLLGNEQLPEGVRKVEMRRVPLLGRIACGRPILAEEERGQYVDAPVDVRADLCLTVQGESMAGVGIHDGDVVFVKQQLTVDNGEIAAVIINDEATLKRWFFYPEEQKLVLRPENAAFQPIVFQGKDLASVTCLGLAVCVMRDRFYKQIESSPSMTEREQEFLTAFRALSDEAQRVYLAALLAGLNDH
jgi:repressor LexA